MKNHLNKEICIVGDLSPQKPHIWSAVYRGGAAVQYLQATISFRFVSLGSGKENKDCRVFRQRHRKTPKQYSLSSQRMCACFINY